MIMEFDNCVICSDRQGQDVFVIKRIAWYNLIVAENDNMNLWSSGIVERGRIMYIDVDKITPRQKLTITTGLCEYKYIMDNWEKNDDDFQEVYYEFYLKARWAIMNKPNNRIPYFQKLQSISPTDSLIDILNELKGEMESQSYELSIGSKLLHTRNPLSPIYDSKVKEYLLKEENVEFWWHETRTSTPRGTSESEKIKHDWSELRKWYNMFLPSTRGKQWIKWFDSNFPTYKWISDVKKVDFIIFAAN